MGRGAAPDPKLQPPAAEVIEHADFLGKPQRVIEWKLVHQRAKTQSLCALRDSRQEQVRRRHHTERGRMMLGDVIGIKLCPVIGLDQLEPIFVVLVERHSAAVEMIEDAYFHGLHSGLTSRASDSKIMQQRVSV